MRGPNKQGFELYDELERSCIFAADVLRRCGALFRVAMDTNKPLEFEITERDLEHLAVIFPAVHSDEERFEQFINQTIASRLSMPHVVRGVERSSARTFSCYVKLAPLRL